jgi:hypothetical protein
MKKIRSTFINYFTEKHDHVFWPSSPAVPVNDPTLMFSLRYKAERQNDSSRVESGMERSSRTESSRIDK